MGLACSLRHFTYPLCRDVSAADHDSYGCAHELGSPRTYERSRERHGSATLHDQVQLTRSVAHGPGDRLFRHRDMAVDVVADDREAVPIP